MEWLTRLPACTALPVNSQRRDIVFPQLLVSRSTAIAGQAKRRGAGSSLGQFGRKEMSHKPGDRKRQDRPATKINEPLAPAVCSSWRSLLGKARKVKTPLTAPWYFVAKVLGSWSSPQGSFMIFISDYMRIASDHVAKQRDSGHDPFIPEPSGLKRSWSNGPSKIGGGETAAGSNANH